MTRFGQEGHNILTLQTHKASLSSFNDKRWISRTEQDEWIYHSFGHYAINTLNNLDVLLNELESDESDEEETNYCIPFKKEPKKRKKKDTSKLVKKKPKKRKKKDTRGLVQ